MDSNKAGVTLFVGGAFALVFLVLGILYIETLPEPSELLALRLELDLNQARADGFQEGYAYAQDALVRGIYFSIGQRGFVDVSDLNSTLRLVPLEQLEAIAAECNSRLEACEE